MIRKIRRALENKNKQDDQEHIEGGRYCNIYKISPIWYGHVERMKIQKVTKRQWSETVGNSSALKEDEISSVMNLGFARQYKKLLKSLFFPLDVYEAKNLYGIMDK
jgi:hypothetical protein